MNLHTTCDILNSKHYMFVTRHWSILVRLLKQINFSFFKISNKSKFKAGIISKPENKNKGHKIFFLYVHTLYTFQYYMKKLLKYIRYFEEKMATCVIQVYRKNIIIFNAEYKLTIPTYNINKQISCFNVLQSKKCNL